MKAWFYATAREADTGIHLLFWQIFGKAFYE